MRHVFGRLRAGRPVPDARAKVPMGRLVVSAQPRGELELVRLARALIVEDVVPVARHVRERGVRVAGPPEEVDVVHRERLADERSARAELGRGRSVQQQTDLDVVVRAEGEIIDRGWALNEASLEKGPRLGVLGAVLEVDGRPVSAFGCDGVLVATPTGSTAWAFSAGGPIVWPDLDAILVVPNNAHALFARPMVTSPDASIAIEIEASGHDALVFCDGRREMVVPAGGRLEVTRCGTPLKWVRLDSAPFTDRLVRKFRLPVTGWRGQ